MDQRERDEIILRKLLKKPKAVKIGLVNITVLKKERDKTFRDCKSKC